MAPSLNALTLLIMGEIKMFGLFKKTFEQEISGRLLIGKLCVEQYISNSSNDAWNAALLMELAVGRQHQNGLCFYTAEFGGRFGVDSPERDRMNEIASAIMKLDLVEGVPELTKKFMLAIKVGNPELIKAIEKSDVRLAGKAFAII
jgi:hypothetical protein